MGRGVEGKECERSRERCGQITALLKRCSSPTTHLACNDGLESFALRS